MRPPQYWLADRNQRAQHQSDRHSECGAGGEHTEHADDQASPKYESSPHFGFNDGGLIQKLHARTSGISDLSTRKRARRSIANLSPFTNAWVPSPRSLNWTGAPYLSAAGDLRPIKDCRCREPN
jgi:hypothetical protein